MAKSKLRLVSPTNENRTVTPRRRPNAELRTREHLTEREVEQLIEAAKANRHGHRDATMVLLAYRHGLRASEICDLRWDQLDFNRAVLHVRRVKQGTPATHPPDRLGNACPSKTPARIRDIPIRVCLRAWGAILDGRICQAARTGGRDGRARNKGAPSHASSCVRFQTGQRRGRYQGLAGLPRPQEHSAYGALHGTGAYEVQGVLARLIGLADSRNSAFR